MAEPESTAEKDPLIRETRWLMSLKPVDRFNYTNQVINSLSESIKEIGRQLNNVEGVAKLTLAQKLGSEFVDDLNEKSVTIIPPIEYAIKAEFRPVFHRFLEDLQKMFNKNG